ncbi:nucleoside diphosphate-linked moiety X motif 17 isoform X3 [Lepidochelys kempii]|uniref:nucleoside diphosphate-linked moiety X motif 17 isoform X3 n=1 Tax=Lepidochelys kempii TaxID=8472 RepID=UPI003C703964
MGARSLFCVCTAPSAMGSWSRTGLQQVEGKGLHHFQRATPPAPRDAGFRPSQGPRAPPPRGESGSKGLQRLGGGVCPIPAGNAGRGIPDCPAAAEPVARRAASRGRPSPLAARLAPLWGLQPPWLPGFLRSRQVPEPGPRSPGAAPMESLARGLVRLAKGSARPERAGFLQRPSFCPIKHLEERQAAALPEALRGRGVDVGVAVVLQSVDRRVLLTRRAKNLSIFPNIWVPPGGHMEPDEQLLEAGLRELQEETGLRLEPGRFSWTMLGLWESVYPPTLSRGLPRRHHVVAYLLLLSTESHQQLQTRIKADGSEVSAYAWLEPHLLECIAAVEDGAENMGHVPSNLPPTIKATELSGGSAQPTELPIATFLNTAPAAGEDVERVSTGTRFALRLWLDTLAVRDNF